MQLRRSVEEEEDFWKDKMTFKEFPADTKHKSLPQNNGDMIKKTTAHALERGETLEGKVSQSAINKNEETKGPFWQMWATLM